MAIKFKNKDQWDRYRRSVKVASAKPAPAANTPAAEHPKDTNKSPRP
jgi:hypothetical protein